MAVTKVLARDWTLEINTGTIGSPVWTEVNCLTSLTFSNSKNDVDTTCFGSAGEMEHLVSSRSREISAEGFYLEDISTGDRDAGQDACETLAGEFGTDSLGQFRITSPGGTTKTFMASANIADVGGGNDDATSWGVTLTVSGSVTVA